MEKLLQYVWAHRLWAPSEMRTTDGEHVDIIDQGTLNSVSGPDFFNAKVKIGDKMWAGDVEIHVRASDWYRHNHEGDSSYDSVVLHVVHRSDADVFRTNGEKIPQIELPCAHDFNIRYRDLVDNPLAELKCGAELALMDGIYLADWLETLAIERLQRKAMQVATLAGKSYSDWSSAIYVVLARALGFGVNAEPFERLAQAVPLRCLRRHTDSPPTIEGLLFGTAGFLSDPALVHKDPYIDRMIEEYQFFSKKYGIDELRNAGWRFGTRPTNMPYRRIATLAAMICDGFPAGHRLLSAANAEEARKIFQFDIMGFWSRRYTFDKPTARSPRALSDGSINTLLINVAAPAQYAYDNLYLRGENCRALELLQSLPPEDNSITRLFERAGVKCRDAFTSQALIELRRSYCEPRKCLYCRIGHKILARRRKP